MGRGRLGGSGLVRGGGKHRSDGNMAAASVAPLSSIRRRRHLQHQRGKRSSSTHYKTLVCSATSGGDLKQVAVLGASGYTGAEITRLHALHPGIAVRSITSERSAGQSFKQVFPHLREDFFQSS